jgi:hypothetical protein
VNLTALVYPGYSSSAFLRAEFDNNSPLTLLSGPGKASIDGAVLGTVRVPFTGVLGSRCVVDLGSDRAIEVTRQLSHASTRDSSSGYFSQQNYRSLSRNVIISIDNKRQHAVDVVVRELVPQPRNNGIRVALIQPPVDLQEELFSGKDFLSKSIGDNITLVKYPGMLEWRRHVVPNKKTTIFFEYTVNWPLAVGDTVNVDL